MKKQQAHDYHTTRETDDETDRPSHSQRTELAEMGAIISSFVGGGGVDEPSADSDGPVAVLRSKASWDKYLWINRNRGRHPKLMVVHFSAAWCGPCRFMDPVFKEMASSPSHDNVDFVKIDVDELEEVAKTFRIEAMPTFVLVKSGEEVSRVLGAKKDELLSKIEHHRTAPAFAA